MNVIKALVTIEHNKESIMSFLELALANLFGESGINLAKTIKERGSMTDQEYDWFLDNIQFNGKESIVIYEGIVDYVYLTY